MLCQIMSENNQAKMIEGELLAVFPIDKAVYFPRTRILLHIFESRYRRMLTDIRQDNFNRLVLTNFNNNQPNPIGVLAEIVQHESLEDGRSNIVVHTLGRVEIYDYFRPYSNDDYAIGEVRPFPEFSIDKEDNEWDTLWQMLYNEFHTYFKATTGQTLNIHKNQIKENPEQSINTACYYIDLEPDLKQELLELDSLIERGHKLGMILKDLNQYFQNQNI